MSKLGAHDPSQLPEIYSNPLTWVRAESDPQLFVETYVSPNPYEPFGLTDPQKLFIETMLKGEFEEGWFAGGNSAGKTWTAKFMGTMFSCYKIKPGKAAFKNYEEYESTPYSVLCTGPEGKQAIELWTAVEESFKNSPFLKNKVTNISVGSRKNIHPRIELDNGAVIDAVGLHDKGRHIEGQAYDLILINEPADARHLIHAYERVLIPRMWRRGGLLCGFGTPKGKGEYYELWKRGQKLLRGKPNPTYEPSVFSMLADSRTNPYADQQKIEKGMRGKSESYVKERVEGAFTDSEHSAFKDSHLEKCIDESLPHSIDPNTRHQYVHGLDLGRKGDYTVCFTFDVTVQPPVMVNRYKAGGGTASWEEIFLNIATIYRRYGGEFVMDYTGMAGDIQAGWMDDLGIPFIPFQFGGTSHKKVALINNLQDLLEKGGFRMPYIHDLMSEVRAYPADLKDAGMKTDEVMALCLAAWGIRNFRPLDAPSEFNR